MSSSIIFILCHKDSKKALALTRNPLKWVLTDNLSLAYRFYSKEDAQEFLSQIELRYQYSFTGASRYALNKMAAFTQNWILEHFPNLFTDFIVVEQLI